MVVKRLVEICDTYILCQCREGGGQNFSARTLRGGADFQRADVEGGQDFSAPESENSSAPLVAVNNERSLRKTWPLLSLFSALCNALASRSMDKCHPVPLMNSEYSTRTAHLMRDAFGPLHYVLNTLHNNAAESNKGRRLNDCFDKK